MRYTPAEFVAALQTAVAAEDIQTLERLAIAAGTYHRLRQLAQQAGVDLDTLEELLAKI